MESNFTSIITPTYNRYSIIGETLDSIINQSFDNWECLVVDDGSTDYTPELLTFYCRKDSRIKYFKRPENYPKGANACRNYGFKKSKGKYIQWLDDDDLISKNKLESQINQLLKPENRKSVSMSSWKFIMGNVEDENLQNDFKEEQRVSIEQYYKIITKGFTFVPSHAFLVSREIVLTAGEWNTHIKINQDAEFFNRVFINSGDIIYNDNKECYALYRYHVSNRITNQKTLDLTENLILGYRIMLAYLNNANIECTAYFKWKLSEIRDKNKNKNNKDLLRKNQFFFRDNDISLNWYNLKNIKYFIYKRYRILYKKLHR